MINLNKRTLIFLLIFCLLLGGAGVTALATSGVLGTVLLSSEEYSDYERLQRDYGKLDSIKQFLTENYYEEVDEEALLKGAYDGMIAGLDDPYSEYILILFSIRCTSS